MHAIRFVARTYGEFSVVKNSYYLQPGNFHFLQYFRVISISAKSSFFLSLSLSFPSIDKLPLVSSPHRINISASAGSRSTRQVGIENFRFFDSFSRALSKFFFFLKASRGREEREREKKWQQLQGLDFIIAVDINLVVINAAYYFRITNCAKWRKPGLLKSVETLGGRRFSELVRIIASI